MSYELSEFTLFYYFNASVLELEEFLNKYSYAEIKYHVKMLDNIELFNSFFKNYKYINPLKINNIEKLRFLHYYYINLNKLYYN